MFTLYPQRQPSHRNAESTQDAAAVENKDLLVEWRKIDHSNVVAAVSQWRCCLCLLVSGHTMDILSTFCDVSMVHVQCAKLMLRIFEFGVLLFDYFVSRQNVTGLKRFIRYGH